MAKVVDAVHQHGGTQLTGKTKNKKRDFVKLLHKEKSSRRQDEVVRGATYQSTGSLQRSPGLRTLAIQTAHAQKPDRPAVNRLRVHHAESSPTAAV